MPRDPLPADFAADPLPFVRTVANGLEGAFADAEGAFLAIGSRLGDAARLLGGLTALFEGLPARLDAPELAEATRHLDAVAAEVMGMATALEREQAILTRLVALARSAAPPIAQLSKTVGAIAVLAVNARIEAAHIRSHGEDFTVFTSEILRLATAAAETINRFSEEQQRLERLLAAACANQTAFEKRHRETLGRVAEQLRHSLASVESRRRRAASAAADISDRSRRIAAGVGEAVSALQIGDITRQRVEHVVQALRLLEQALGADAGEDDSQRMAIAGTVARVQAAQTARARQDFEGETRRVAAALSDLAGAARDIAQRGSELVGGSAGDSRSFLAELADELRQAAGLIRESEGARGRVDEAAGEATASLARLLDQMDGVRRIEVDMRLVGLNTAMRCNRLGAEGRTLTVIAQELRSYANATVADAAAVLTALREIQGIAARLDQERAGQDARHIADLERVADAAVHRFESVDAVLAEALGALTRQGEQAASLLGDTMAGMHVHEAVGRSLGDAGAGLERIAAAAPAGATDSEGVKRRLLALGCGSYTMASEREIHAMLSADDPAAARAPAAAAEPSGGGIDDLLF